MAEARFNNKTVLITGAANGFGAVAARRFADEGAKLVLFDIDKAGVKEIGVELGKTTPTSAHLLDVVSENDWIAFFEHSTEGAAPIDIAINNAGIGQKLQPLAETSEAHFDQIMAINTKGVFLGMKYQLPGMIKRRGGVILNVASAAGLVGAGQMAAYAASKHAVIGLTRSAADEVARHGIRVNALCPSFAPTNLFKDMAEDIGARQGVDRETTHNRITSRIPMRRLATVDEVVQAMLWACDPANSFMTGQALSIDGGLTAV